MTPDQVINDQNTQSGIEQVYRHFSAAYATKDVSVIESIYEQSAIYLSPGDSIGFGQQSFIPGFASMFHNAEVDSIDLAIEFQIVDRKLIEDRAVDVGYYRLTRTKDGQEPRFSVGKFITVLRKQTEGDWKFTHDGYSNAPEMAWF